MHTFFIMGDVISLPSETLLYEAEENPIVLLIIGVLCIAVSAVHIKIFRKKK